MVTTVHPADRVRSRTRPERLAELPGLLARLQGAGLAVRDLEVRSASLQAVFLELTGKDLRE